MSSSVRCVIAVSEQPGRAELLGAILTDTDDYDVVVLESVARGFSRIKQVTPDLVIVVFTIDDAAACQLLSMLTVDRETLRIPVLTWVTRPEQSQRGRA
ncbi:MAG TPA: hypothetical protein VGY48_19925 [Vicinamibacterales bacterium]|jgi:DNA-binding NarL/FixJ family response regulator|nr:hypothetical protein [Vicinamibacterales bacterium]